MKWFSRRKRRNLKGILLVLLLVFLVGEGSLRVLHSWMMNAYKLKQGFSSPEAYNLLFVGDSFTAGGGTESGLGYPEYMGQELRRRDRRQRGVEVVNIALSGTETEIHRKRLERYLESHPIQPDLVFVVTGRNNFTSNEAKGAYLTEGAGGIRPGIGTLLLHHSLFLTVLNELSGHHIRFRIPWEDEAFEKEAFQQFVLHRYRSNLDQIILLTRNRNLPLVFGTYIRFEGDDRKNFHSLKEVTDRYRVPLVNIFSVEWDRKFKEKGLYSKDGWHPNDEGQQVLAERFLWKMQEQGLIPQEFKPGEEETEVFGRD